MDLISSSIVGLKSTYKEEIIFSVKELLNLARCNIYDIWNNKKQAYSLLKLIHHEDDEISCYVLMSLKPFMHIELVKHYIFISLARYNRIPENVYKINKRYGVGLFFPIGVKNIIKEELLKHDRINLRLNLADLLVPFLQIDPDIKHLLFDMFCNDFNDYIRREISYFLLKSKLLTKIEEEAVMHENFKTIGYPIAYRHG